MKRRQYLPLGAIVSLALGLSVLLVAGCDSSPGNEYRSFSAADADRADEARAAHGEGGTPLAGDESSSADEASAVVLAAAQAAAHTATQGAARVARPSPLTTAGGGDVAIVRTTASTSPETLQPSTARVPEAETSAAAIPSDLAGIGAGRAAGLVGEKPPVRTIELLIPDRSFSVEGPSDAIRISYDDFDLLKILNMDPVPPNASERFPEWLAGLDGKRVRVRGFMYPTFQETGISGFVLARDNQICCFGRNPKIYDLVEVTLTEGVTTDYIQGRPFDVVGNFHIRPEADGDELWQLYQIDDAVVVDN